jgi:hypothetical protein
MTYCPAVLGIGHYECSINLIDSLSMIYGNQLIFGNGFLV